MKRLSAAEKRIKAFERIYDGKHEHTKTTYAGDAGSYALVHPLSDDKRLLRRLSMRPKDCKSADAWWRHAGNDVALLQVRAVGHNASAEELGFYVRRAHGRTYLRAIVKAGSISNACFKHVVEAFHQKEFWREDVFRPI